MDARELWGRVRDLRAEGRTPKQVAAALGMRPAEVSQLVPRVAREQAEHTPEPAIVGCWVSPGWREGIGAPASWPDAEVPDGVGHGIVSVLIARRHRRDKVSVAGYLVDVYRLGVKDALGPKVMDDAELRTFVRGFFAVYEAPPLAVPIEMARELVGGTVAYARDLRFEPHADFAAVAGHLGAWELTGTVRFGRDGTPFFIEGPHDNAMSVMRTLRRSVGDGNFHFSVAV